MISPPRARNPQKRRTDIGRLHATGKCGNEKRELRRHRTFLGFNRHDERERGRAFLSFLSTLGTLFGEHGTEHGGGGGRS